MENTKKCPVGLDGFQHYCPDDIAQHESKETMLRHLEMKVRIGITPLSQEQGELLQFLRTGQRSKERTIKINLESVRASNPETAAPKVEPAPVPAISLAQQKAMDDLARLKAGVPFSRSFERVPRIETVTAELPKPEIKMTVEDRARAEWDRNANIRSEFTSFNSYLCYKRASEVGKTKIHRGIGGL